MKKFSTIALLLALSTSAYAADESHPTQTNCSFLANAPDQHLVVRGDTLWGISTLFLEHPWCWPQVWGLNKAEIKNPHWIYPGQMIYLDRAAGRLRLGTNITNGEKISNTSGSSSLKLHPQFRDDALAIDAIPSIPQNEIEPFLIQPIVLDENEIKDSPRIVATPEGHVNVGKNEKAYVLGDLKGIKTFQVYSPGVALKDPETKKVLGYEFAYLGTVKLVHESKLANEAHSFIISSSKLEMSEGDRLRPVPDAEVINYIPHPPSTNVDARVVSIYGGIAQAGQHQIISINRGSSSGLDIGTVLQLYHRSVVIQDKVTRSAIKLPDEEYGTLFVYRVFNNVSYGLIMQVSDSVQVGDVAKTPE